MADLLLTAYSLFPDNIDWRAMFAPDISPVETIIRGSVGFLGIFVLLSLARNREAGPLSVNNMLVLVLIAASAHGALSGGSHSVTNALVLVATIVGWSYAVDWLSYRSRIVRGMLRPDPLALIEDGRLIERNMQRESVTTEELMAQLRLQGIEEVSGVKRACLEPDGQISVIRRNADDTPPRARHHGTKV